MSRPALTPKQHWDNIIYKLQQGKVETWGDRDVYPAEKHALIQLALIFREKNIGPYELAEKAECSFQNVYQMFSGKFGASLRTLQKYADIAGVVMVMEFREMDKRGLSNTLPSRK